MRKNRVLLPLQWLRERPSEQLIQEVVVTLSNVASSVTVPDGKMDCMIENESTTDEEEQSAACYAMAKGKAKKTV